MPSTPRFYHTRRHSLMSQMALQVPSPSAVLVMTGSLNGPKATVKALTEMEYWVPGVRSDSTIVVVLSVVFTKTSPSEDNSCS